MGDFNFAIQPESELDNVLNALEQGTFEDKVLPAGEYQVVIYDYKMDRNKKDNGDWLRLHFEVKGGPESGNNFVVFFNIVHENEVAERIAKKSSLVYAALVGCQAPLITAKTCYIMSSLSKQK